MQLIVREVWLLDSLAQANKRIVVTIFNKTEQDKVLEYIRQHPGDTPVSLSYAGIEYPLKDSVNATPAALQFFQDEVREIAFYETYK